MYVRDCRVLGAFFSLFSLCVLVKYVGSFCLLPQWMTILPAGAVGLRALKTRLVLFVLRGTSLVGGDLRSTVSLLR